MQPYNIPEQNCKKCLLVDHCKGLDEAFNDITREYKNADGVVAVQIINCDNFKIEA